MKKSLIFIFIILLLISLPFNKVIIKDSFNYLLLEIVPILFLNILLSSLFIEFDGELFILNKINNKIISKFIYKIILFFLIINLGLPSNIFLIKKQVEKKIISQDTAVKILYIIGSYSSTFIYFLIINYLDYYNKLIISLIYFIYIIMIIINFDIQIKNCDYNIKTSASFLSILKNSIITTLTILFYLLTFDCILSLFNNCFIAIFIEINYAVTFKILNQYSNPLLILLLMFFPSIAIIYQCGLQTRTFNFLKFIKYKLLILICSIIIYFFFQKLQLHMLELVLKHLPHA